MTTATLPITVAQITPDWLSRALGASVTTLETREIIWGTATKVRLVVGFADGQTRDLCVKGCFDEASRAALGGTADEATKAEARFFRDLAPRLDVTLPRAWYADAHDLQGVIVLDDLAASGATFGSPTAAWAPNQAAGGLDVLAELHGSTWNEEFCGLEWLTIGSQPVRAAVQALFSAEHWDASPPALPPALGDRERLLRAYEALWASSDAATCCLTHNDAHLGNAYVTSDGKPVFLDWASVARCPWAADVAYFLTGALTVEDRRAHERDLLDGYLAALHRRGGPALDRTQAWDDYRRHLLHGVIWAVVPPQLQSPENVAAMTERYVAAITDHATLHLLDI